MAYGPAQVFEAGIASGASTSSSIDLGGKSYSKLAVGYVTMSTGALVTVYGAATATGTFKPVVQRHSTSTVQYGAVAVPTTASGQWAVFDAPPFRYLKLITSDVVSGGVSFTVCAFD